MAAMPAWDSRYHLEELASLRGKPRKDLLSKASGAGPWFKLRVSLMPFAGARSSPPLTSIPSGLSMSWEGAGAS